MMCAIPTKEEVMNELGSPRPFDEKRRVVGSVDVSLTKSNISSLPVKTKENLLSRPLPGFELDAAVKIHIRERQNSGYYFFEVHVEGLPEGSDVWVKGDFQWRVRSFDEKNCTRTIPLLPSPITWLRGNGCLGYFVFSHTNEISGKVTVYGAVEDSDSGTRCTDCPHLRSIRQLTALCDVVLRAAGRNFPAHRVALAARSPVFLAMFSGDYKETKGKVVDIAVDCSSEVFGVFVDFFYSGSTRKMDCGDLLHLLELAERHMVDDLKAECVKQLLSVDSRAALDLLKASLEQPFVPKQCREHAFRLIRHDWKTISASEEWPKFCTAHPIVAATIESMMMVV